MSLQATSLPRCIATRSIFPACDYRFIRSRLRNCAVRMHNMDLCSQGLSGFLPRNGDHPVRGLEEYTCSSLSGKAVTFALTDCEEDGHASCEDRHTFCKEGHAVLQP